MALNPFLAIGKRMKFGDYADVQAEGPFSSHELLAQLCLVPTEGTYMCPKCGRPLKLRQRSDSPDGYVWQCSAKVSLRKQKRSVCGTRVEYRTGTFLARSRLPTGTILHFVQFWLTNMALTNIAKLLRINVRTCFDWASFCREVVYYAMLSRKEPLGGPGKVVEIDESKFGRRKYHRGHCVEGQWVFGGYERGSGKVFMVPVDKRDRSTLVPLIQEWIRPGTTIISDCWKAYEGLQELGYQHLTVNNSVTFKDSKTGAHTNSIEGMWRGAKAILSAPGQRKKAHLPGNLAKYMFLKRCRDLGLEDFIEFCKYAGELYDPRRPRPNQFEAGVDSSQESVGSTSHATIGKATVTASTANREGTSAIASMEEYDKDTTSIDSAVEHEATAPIDSAEEYNMPEHNLNT